MTSKQLRQLWFAVGTVLFCLSFNFCSWSQLWSVVIPVPSFTNVNPAVANYLGVLFCAPILFVELLITRQYMRCSQSMLWAGRIPTFFEPAPDFAVPYTRILQATLYAGTLVFAEIAQLHFFEKFMKSEVVEVVKDGTRVFGLGWLSKLATFVPLSQAFDKHFKLLGCTYYPFWEPWAFVAGELLLLWMFMKTTFGIFLPQKVKMAQIMTIAEKADETPAAKLRSMPAVAMKAVEVFCSYSHKDERFRKQLEAHLTVLLNEGLISSWHDRLISPGTECKDATDSHLNTAGIILLLVSADFLASDYCHNVELKRAMERQQEASARVIPIILRHCDWRNSPIGKLQALPKDGKPVAIWANRDLAFTDIVDGIRAVLRELDS